MYQMFVKTDAVDINWKNKNKKQLYHMLVKKKNMYTGCLSKKQPYQVVVIAPTLNIVDGWFLDWCIQLYKYSNCRAKQISTYIVDGNAQWPFVSERNFLRVCLAEQSTSYQTVWTVSAISKEKSRRVAYLWKILQLMKTLTTRISPIWQTYTTFHTNR